MPKIQYYEYQYVFTKVLNYPKALERLMQHMMKEHNEESLLFYCHCLEFDSFVGPSEKLVALVQLIYNSFVKRNSNKQINLSNEEVETITKAVAEFEQLPQEQQTRTSAKNVFMNGITAALHMIENDTFPRFVRSEFWIGWVRKTLKTAADLEQVAVHKSHLKQVLITAEDEERLMMTTKDISLVNNSTRDGINWDLRMSRHFGRKMVRSVMLFRSTLNVLDQGCEKKHGKIWTTKTVWTFNCSSTDVFKVFFSEEKYSEIFTFSVTDSKSTILKVEDMETPMKAKQQEGSSENISNNNNSSSNVAQNSSSEGSVMSKQCLVEPEFSTEQFEQQQQKQEQKQQFDPMFYTYVSVINMNLGVPFANKRFIPMCGTSTYSPECNTYFDLLKPYPIEALSEADAAKKGRAVHMRLYNYQVFRDLGDNCCQWIQVTSNAFGGKMDGDNAFTKWIEKKVATNFLIKASKRMEKCLVWYHEAGKPELHDKFGKFALIEMNKPVMDKLLEEQRNIRSQSN